MTDILNVVNPIHLFSDYMKVTGVPTLKPNKGPDPGLTGKKLGVINGSSWTSLWSTYFGKKMLPGVKIINVGNEAVQFNFMEAHQKGQPTPPQININLFCKYAKDLYDLFKVDAILITCSTMNRAFKKVSKHMKPFGVPVLQIESAMMEEAINSSVKILVMATHGPTLANTQSFLLETADRLGKSVDFVVTTVEESFEALGKGNITRHNEILAEAIRNSQKKQKIDIVIMAQLSMSIFIFTYPDPKSEFGIPVLTSAETGFKHAGEVLRGIE